MQKRLNFINKICFELICLYDFELLIDNQGPCIIKTPVFGAYCLDKLEIISCQFLAANHWRANTLELSSKVKVCDHNKIR